VVSVVILTYQSFVLFSILRVYRISSHRIASHRIASHRSFFYSLLTTGIPGRRQRLVPARKIGHSIWMIRLIQTSVAVFVVVFIFVFVLAWPGALADLIGFLATNRLGRNRKASRQKQKNKNAQQGAELVAKKDKHRHRGLAWFGLVVCGWID
jgi:hypothetical protein